MASENTADYIKCSVHAQASTDYVTEPIRRASVGEAHPSAQSQQPHFHFVCTLFGTLNTSLLSPNMAVMLEFRRKKLKKGQVFYSRFNSCLLIFAKDFRENKPPKLGRGSGISGTMCVFVQTEIRSSF